MRAKGRRFVVTGVLYLELCVGQNLVPALLNRVGPGISSGQVSIHCDVQGFITKGQVDDMCPSRAVARPVSDPTLKLMDRNVWDTLIVFGWCPSE